MTGAYLHLISSNQRRGAEVFATDLVAELGRSGEAHRLLALTAGSGATLPVDALGTARFDPRLLLAVRRQAAAATVTIGHGSSTLPALGLATAVSRIPFVYRGIGDPAYWTASTARRQRVRFFLRRARAVTALWPGAVSTLVDRLGVDSTRVRVIPNGVPAARFPRATADERQRARDVVGVGAAPVVVVLGQLSAEKRVDRAIAAMARLPEMRLVVAGDGSERGALEEQARRLAPDRVHFVGVQEPATVLAAADVLVLSSESEGMPAVLIEAGFAGLPAVTADVGAVREVVVDGETGFVIDADDPAAVADAIVAAVASGAALGLAARQRCLARFEIGVVADQWRALLHDVEAGRL